MNKTERRAYFKQHPKRRFVWLLLLWLQTIGLGLTIAAVPYFVLHLSSHAAVLSVNGLLNDRVISVVGSLLFLSLVVLNILAVLGIWRFYRLVQPFLLVKLSAAIFLILSVVILATDYLLLFIYVPLCGSLIFMNWAYSRLIAAQ